MKPTGFSNEWRRHSARTWLSFTIGGWCWPASVSGKWVNRISIRNVEHDGPKMGGTAYRVPCKPVAPGEKVADEDMCIVESMPVNR